MLTCGHADHPQDCLCDVVIKTTVKPILGFDQVWYAPIVARATGYKGEGGPQLAEFLTILGEAYDSTRQVANAEWGWLDDVLSSGLRTRVTERLTAGASIVDLPELLDEPFVRIVAALSQGQPSVTWTWTERQWVSFESYVLITEHLSLSAAAKRFGLSRPQASTLFAAWGRAPSSPSTASHTTRARQLLAEQPTASLRAIHAQLSAEGHIVTYNWLQKLRGRISQV